MFTSSAQKIISKTSEWLENTLFGRSSDQNATLETAKIDENSLPDGFSIIDTTSSSQNSNLWMTLQRVKDIALGKLESIDLYAVVDGKLAGIVKENVGISDILRLNLGNYSSFALVRDSGLRSKVEELGNVVLSGLMPKNGTAEVVDVTDEYENFVGGRSVSKEGEADEELGGQSVAKEGETVRTLAAYDISITNDGEEYQPEDKPIEVKITDEAIATAVANGNAIELWHVLDDGTTERVENFTIDGDTVTFSASGFSVYVLTETTVEKILTAADGNVYRITVTYDGSAQIPEGAELVVTEVDGEDYLTATAQALGIDEDYLLYRKFLDISFKTTDENGDERIIEPATPVKVQIELLDVDAGADKLQVVHFGEDGAEKVAATATDNAVVSFTSDEFSVYGIGNVLEPLATAEMDEASVEILGFGTETQVVGVDAPEVEEGLEVLGAYNLSDAGENKLWIKAELKEDVELTDMESVAVYSVKDSNGEDEIGKAVEELAEMGTITELPTTEFAVVKDSGYRHLSFELNVDEENEGNGEKTVTLDGMMPKAAEAAAVDVTENYTDHDFNESAPSTPIINEETGSESTPVEDENGVGEEAGVEEEQDKAEEATDNEGEEPSHTTNRVTLAAFDISIQNGDNEYQPDDEHPVDVTITDSRILSGDHIELWHIRDDGSQERVEEFTVENGLVSFSAMGFSTYAIVYNITTYYQTSTGETYKITVEYGDNAGLPEDVKLHVAEVDAEEFLADTAAALGVDDSYLLYKKFFDISFVVTGEDGEETTIEPFAPVSVKIELQDVTAGADKLQVVHFGADGVEKVESQATDEAVVSFESKDFSVFGVGNVLETLATTETDEASIEILGFTGEAQINTADAPVVEEGLEVLGAYTIGDETESKLWIKADVKDGVELSALESVVIYTIGGENAAEGAEEEQNREAIEEQNNDAVEGQNNEAAEEQNGEAVEQAVAQSATQITELAAAGIVAELNVANFALVKDTGYRHLSFEINVGGEDGQTGEEAQAEDEETEEAGKIILDGMMPKMATAEAIDVTDAYADHEYVVPEEEQTIDQEQIDELNTEADGEDVPEEQPVSNDAGENDPEQPVNDGEEPASEESQEGTEEPVEEEPQEEAEEQKRTTLAAFNITISNNNSEYQPDEDHPITVVIRDDRITGENLELWHIKDDGSEERVEEFTVEDGKVEFVATGFSVYTIVEAPVPYQPIGERQYIYDLDELSEHYGDVSGFYISYYRRNDNKVKDHLKSTEWFMTKTPIGSGNTAMLVEKTSMNEATTWFFEKVEGENNQYRIYTYTGPNRTGKKYIQQVQKGNTGIRLSDTGTPFIVSEMPETDKVEDTKTFWVDIPKFHFKVYNDTMYLQHSNGGGNIRLYKNTGDDEPHNNSQLIISYASSVTYPFDYYELDGKTYSIAYYEESVKASGLTSEVNASNGLEAAPLLVKPSILNQVGEMLVAEDNNLPTWTFRCIEENKYRVSTIVGGVTKYLKICETGLELVEDDQTDPSLMVSGTIISIDSGTTDFSGKYRLSVDGYYLLLKNGSTNSGFESQIASDTNEKYAWLTFVENDDILIDEDFQIYTAKKVSIAHHKNDPSLDAVQNGDQVVIYARVWNDTTLKYEHYAINHEGQMFRVYESGDTIQWVGSQVNSALWDFTAYYWTDGNGDYDYLKDDNGNLILDSNNNPIKVENLYYELQNVYSGQYLAPLYGDHLFQDGTLGIHLDGRSGGYDYSTITAWDDDANMYVDLIGGDVKDTNYLGTRKKNVLKPYYFYFAKMTDTNVVTKLSTVDTVNNSDYGIHMKMIDFNNGTGNRDPVQSQYFNGDDNGPGVLSVKLSGDYPVAQHGNQSSLSSLYSGAADVNHLFIQSTYNNSGYFVYDSTQNYAYLPGGAGDFTVYDQLGTIKGRTSAFSSYHGQFFPYNDLYQQDAQGNYILDGNGDKIPWPYDETIFNTKDILGNELPDSDPRKGEGLHAIPQNQIDYFYAMEMTAGFTQTVSGEDSWGHDIIFEFSGDDDFWLYVDGDLVLDLGGVHSAMSGSVNFKTGLVKVSTNHKPRVPVWNFSTGQVEYKYSGTLRQIFEANYRTTNPGCTFDEVEAYLDERFDGDIFKDYSTHEMRMFYMERGAGGSNLKMRFNLASVKPGHVVLSKELSGVDYPVSSIGDFFFQIRYLDGNENEGIFDGNNTTDFSVLKYESIDEVTHYDSIVLGGVTYEHVYKLKAGEKADIDMPDATIKYWITECGVDTTIFDHVYVNDEEVTANVSSGNSDRADFSTDRQNFNQRKHVDFVNHVDPNALGTLHITKNLYDETGAVLTDDLTPFTFRLYMGTENEDLSSISAANQIRYYVKYGENYCKWDPITKTYVVTDKTASDLHRNDDDPDDENSWDYYVVHTSKYGSIARIPAGYTVEIREILKNTKYKVEERNYEIPEGYTLRDYLLNGTITEASNDNPNALPQGAIIGGQTTTVEVENIKGWGFIMNKIWTDEQFMLSREDTYFALYKGDTIVPGTLKRLSFHSYTDEEESTEDDPFKQLRNKSTSLYWYLERLEQGGTFNDYKVYEVTLDDLTDPSTLSIDSDNNVTGYSGTITRVTSQLKIDGRQEGDTIDGEFTYDVSYDRGDPGEIPATLSSIVTQPEDGTSAARNNIRVDAITNARQGITLYKQDMLGNALEGAKFELIELDTDGSTVISTKTFTSDKNGLITTAYLKDKVQYKLREVSAPIGYMVNENDRPSSYHAAEQVITLYLNTEAENKVTVGGDLDYIQKTGEDSNPNPVIIIKNKKYTLQIKKTDSAGVALSGVQFALYPQVIRSVNGVETPGRDYYPVRDPIIDFSDLMTDGDGFVCYKENGSLENIQKLFENGTLKPGTYYLHEKGTYSQVVGGQTVEYQPLTSDVIFTVSPTGTVTEFVSDDGTIHGFPDGTELVDLPEETNVKPYQINVKNAVAGENNVTIQKIVADGTTADDGKSYEFTAKLYLPDKTTPWTYGKDPWNNGELSFSLTNNEIKTLTVPKGAILRIVESYNSNFNTQYDITLPSGITIPQELIQDGQTCEITVPSTEDTTTAIVCTNTRIYTVEVRKVLDDLFADSETFVFTGTLTLNGNEPTSFENPFDSDIEMQVSENNEASMDFHLLAGQKLKIEEVLTDPTISETYSTVYRVNTHEDTSTTPSTIEVRDEFTDYSETPLEIPIVQSDRAQIIEVKNTRRTKQVIISKTLDDPTVTAQKDFTFTVTLYAPDGTTPVEDYELKYTIGTSTTEQTKKTHKTLTEDPDDPENTDYEDPTKPGIATFTLTPQNGSSDNTAYLTILNIPYGAYLKVEEEPATGTNYSTTINGYEGLSSTRQVLVDRTDTTNTDPNTPVDNNDAFLFVNKIEGKNLIISKNVTGDMMQGGETFQFTVTGLGSELTVDSYKIYDEVYDSNGRLTGTILAETVPVYTSAEGKLTFELRHHQRIQITGIPAQSEIVITEADYTGCVQHYIVKRTKANGETTAIDTASTIGRVISFGLDSHKKVEITNEFPAVAPTGHTSRHTPWLLLLLFGLMLLIGGGAIVKWRRGDDSDDGGTLEAINTTPLNTSPPSGQSASPTQPTYSTTDAQNQMNSVCVEGTHTPPQMRRDVSCPQAKLWMNSGGGDAG